MDTVHTPICVGFIMDGNRRWAKEKGLSTLEGHTKGYEAMQNIISIVHKAGIAHAVFYAFSTENWGRSEEEVSYLMNLLAQGLRVIKDDLKQKTKKINMRIIGERTRLPEYLLKEIDEIEALHYAEPELTVWVALSYGGRAEIVDAVNKAIEKGKTVTEETFAQYLWTAEMPDPDIIVRTSGEQRISNFLLWKCAYSELYFVDTYWPDFGESEFQSMLDIYGKRQRRKGT